MSAVLELLANYLVHSSVLLCSAWLVERSGVVRSVAGRELLWRAALLAGLVTASAPLLLPPGSGAFGSMGGRQAAGALSPEPSKGVVVGATPRQVSGSVSASANREEGVGTVSLSQGDRSLPAMPPRLQLEMPRVVAEFAGWLALAWFAVALVGIFRILHELSRRRAEVARLQPCRDVRVVACVAKLSAAHGLSAPRIVEDPESGSPTANPGWVLTLPAWSLRDGFSPPLEATLAHELGHLARRDPTWRCVAAALCAIFWFQPLNRLAARRLGALAELGADGWAISATGNRHALAQSLFRCAQELVPGRELSLAVPMVGNASVLHRIERILEERQMKTALKLRHWLGLAAVAFGALVILPVIVVTGATAKHGTLIETGRGTFGERHLKADINDNGLHLAAEIRGDVTFNQAETDIESLGRGGEAWIEQTINGVARRIEFVRDGNRIARNYEVNGRAQPLDAAGRAWVAAAIPTLIRESAFDADARVARIHSRSGVDGVLIETARIQGHFARRTYLQALASLGALDAAQFDRALGLTRSIESDFERRSVLATFVETQTLVPSQQVSLLRVVAALRSDFEKRSVLEVLAPRLADEPEVAAQWVAVLATMKSDFERREAVVAVAKGSAGSRALRAAAISAIPAMGSDFEKRSALTEYASHAARAPALALAYVAATRSIDSDFERRESLLGLLDEGSVDARLAGAILESVDEMQSDFEKRAVLVQTAARMPADPALIERYRAVARGMGDYERAQAEKGLDRFAG